MTNFCSRFYEVPCRILTRCSIAMVEHQKYMWNSGVCNRAAYKPRRSKACQCILVHNTCMRALYMQPRAQILYSEIRQLRYTRNCETTQLIQLVCAHRNLNLSQKCQGPRSFNWAEISLCSNEHL